MPTHLVCPPLHSLAADPRDRRCSSRGRSSRSGAIRRCMSELPTSTPKQTAQKSPSQSASSTRRHETQLRSLHQPHRVEADRDAEFHCSVSRDHRCPRLLPARRLLVARDCPASDLHSQDLFRNRNPLCEFSQAERRDSLITDPDFLSLLWFQHHCLSTKKARRRIASKVYGWLRSAPAGSFGCLCRDDRQSVRPEI